VAEKQRFGILKDVMEAFEADEVACLRPDGKLIRTKGSTAITMAGFDGLEFTSQVYVLNVLLGAHKDIIEHYLGEKQAALRNGRIAVPVPGGMIVPPGMGGPQG